MTRDEVLEVLERALTGFQTSRVNIRSGGTGLRVEAPDGTAFTVEVHQERQ